MKSLSNWRVFSADWKMRLNDVSENLAGRPAAEHANAVVWNGVDFD